jgi:hypothetical protein
MAPLPFGAVPWKTIDPQLVRATVDGEQVEVKADRWDDFTGAIACEWPPPGSPQTASPAERRTILAGEYTALDEATFEAACADGTRI